jgi:hypothetical protein
MFDVIEIKLKPPYPVLRVMVRNLDAGNAEAFVKMAVIRRGVEDSFFKRVPAGQYNDDGSLKE